MEGRGRWEGGLPPERVIAMANVGLLIVVVSGMSGFFAVLMDTEEGPVETGFGRYATPEEARREAVIWAAEVGWDLGFALTPDEQALYSERRSLAEEEEVGPSSFPQTWED